MADSVSLRAYAKINLNLDITGKSGDESYHTVEMVMQSVDIYDTVTVSIQEEISIKCNGDVPEDENNIAVKAAKEFFKFTEIDGKKIETDVKKFGAMLGDYVEVGCNSVLNPGSVVGRQTNIYPLSFVRGYVPEKSIYKRLGEIAKKR